MKNELKRKLASYILAGTIIGSVSAKGFAEDVDMTPIDIDAAIAELVPDETKVVETPAPTTSPVKESPAPAKETTEPSVIKAQEETEEQKNCEHTYNEWPDDVANQVTGTCTEDGSYDDIYYCIKCGAMKVEHVTMAHPGHKWVTDNVKYDYVEPTYEKEGSYKLKYTCNNKGCHETHEEIIIVPRIVPPVYPTSTPGPQKGPVKHTNPETGDENLDVYKCLLALGLIGTSSLVTVNQKKKVLSKRK